MKRFSKIIKSLSFLVALSVFLLSPAYAAMNNYCITPPFIVAGVNPNLLMMIDSSASMFDLTYIDKGSTTPLRTPYYCYDRTYFSSQSYAGYFEAGKKYEYDFTNGYFYEVSAPVWASCDKYIPNTLCVMGTNLNNDIRPKSVSGFIAEGNYLNWLSASKFDVQKQILTGGKYIDKVCSSSTDVFTSSCNTNADCPSGDTCSDVTDNYLKAETRGCVGRRFLKEPITQETYTEGGTNTPLGLTFAVRGPEHPSSQTLLSPGGQTYLEIYAGDYVESNCQKAVDDIIAEENKNTITGDIELCLNYDSKGQYCSLDITVSCDDDADCAGTAGTCNGVVSGTCGTGSDGICGVLPANEGTCADNSGTCTGSKICFGGPKAGDACTGDNKCPQGVCRARCVLGGKAGSQCINNNDCIYKSCSAPPSRVGQLCSNDDNCDLKTCTNAGGTNGHLCTVNADCHNKACTAGLPGTTPCLADADCNAPGTCQHDASIACFVDTDCNTGYAGVCIKPVTQQIKSTYGQSVHECYQYWNTGHLVGNNWYTMMTNPSGCNQMYKELFTCNGGSRDAKLCVVDADCTGGGTCINGPQAIRQGSPVLVCGLGYVGYCASSTCSGGVNNGNICATAADCPGGSCWQDTIWNAREYTAGGGYSAIENCVKAKFEAFCGDTQVPPVTDPSDDPSSTETFDNLPAIIGDMSIGAQLGDPLDYTGCTENCALAVKVQIDTPPKGLIQDFQNLIHFGAMRFNFFGTPSECPANIPCEKICQTAGTTCVSTADCPPSDSCVSADNKDGAHIMNTGGAKEGYILGRCSSTTATTCTSPTHCPVGESCVYSVGNHASGFIKAIDDIFANTWTPFSEGFYNAIGYFAQRTDTRINDSGDPIYKDFATEAEASDYKDPVQFTCQKNNILLITDGMSTADLNSNVNLLVSSYNDGDGRIDAAPAACPKYAGSRNLDDLAWLAKHRNINDFDETPALTDPEINSKTITTYVVFNGVPSNDPGECNPDALLSETAENGCGTQTGCYQRAEDPAALRQALREAFLLIAGKAASGTAASVLASGEGTGANLVQAIFYPERTFGANEILWSGSMKNLWYSIDPFLGSSTIREDTNNDKILNLKDDYIVNFFFDPLDNLTKANLYSDANDGNGVKDTPSTPAATPYFESVKSLWESGLKLWSTLPANRTIYTTVDESTRIPFNTSNVIGTTPTLASLLQSPSTEAAEKLINYVRGTDVTTKFCDNAFGTSCTSNSDCTAPGTCIAKFCSSTVVTKCANDGDCPAGETCRDEYRSRTVSIGATSGVWKLGDIVNSTPRIASWVPLNFYYKTYLDRSYKAFTESSTYTDRGMVFVGANDGMLHAFKLGYLKLFEEKYKKAQISNSKADLSATQIGQEEWAFIPKNALPYLQYMAEPSYCHLYYSDLTPYIFDASIGGLATADRLSNGSSWRTILIGGMRQGGACKDAASSLGVQVPAANVGYSSYFALDITNLNNPQVLWEFSNADITDATGTGKLGFATSGPAVVRIDDPGDTSHKRNGHWFVVFGSGPTGPIDPTTHQFKALSDQNMKLFVLDLMTGALLTEIDTGIPNAFSGSMLQAAIDFDQNDTTKPGFYSDDALYFGFTRADGDPALATTQWNVGGVLRLLTKNDPNPDNWALSTVIGCDSTVSVSECIGPVTAGISKLQNYKNDKVRLFFGTGRFFYRIADAIDDADIGRRIYGVVEPCYSNSNDPFLDTDCTTKLKWGDDLAEAADETGTTNADGWYINLDSSAGTLKAERMVTDPLATPIGAVFFTTTKPSSDVCEFGGASHLWAVDYDTGGKVSSSVLRGKALLQVSTGSIEEVSLKTAFTERDGRRTPAFQGVPPAGSPPGILIPPKPMDKILHIREQ